MHNSTGGGHSFPITKIFTDDYLDRRTPTEQHGDGQLATEDLRLLVAAMID